MPRDRFMSISRPQDEQKQTTGCYGAGRQTLAFRWQVRPAQLLTATCCAHDCTEQRSFAPGAAGTLAGTLLGVEYHLAEPHRGRGNLHALVGGAVLQRLLQAQQ